MHTLKPTPNNHHNSHTFSLHASSPYTLNPYSLHPNTLGFASISALSLLLICLVSPTCYTNTHAETLSTTANSSLSLSLTQPDDINITPTANGQFGVTQTKLAISTSNNSGYKLYINTLDSTNAMLSTNGSQNTQITALPSATTSTNFPSNTWGYSLTTTQTDDTTIYNPMPETSTLAYDTDQTAGNHYLSFAANINTALPAGTYTNTVQISAIANPQKITNLSELTYMQDMTSSICQDTKAANGANTVTPGNEVEKRLIDARDGKEYWVSKLADQNCWMVQNLALDLTAGQKLTNINTDLNSKTEWLVPTTTESAVPAKIANLSANNNAAFFTTRSWNLGEYILATPDKAYSPQGVTTTGLCTASNSTDGVGIYDSVVTGQTLTRCKDFQLVTDWQPTFVAKAGTWNGANLSYVTANASTKTYDAHYLIGNLYQFNAATAGSGGREVVSAASSVTDAKTLLEAQDSVCPRGWQLPTGGANGNTGLSFNRPKSYLRLLISYGYPSVINTTNYPAAGTAPNRYSTSQILTTTINGANRNPAKQPIRLVRVGAIYLQYGSLRHAGRAAMFITSTVSTDAKYMFGGDLLNNRLDIDSTSERVYGVPVRCLAR